MPEAWLVVCSDPVTDVVRTCRSGTTVRMNENVLMPVRATTPTASSSCGLQQHIIPYLRSEFLSAVARQRRRFRVRAWTPRSREGMARSLETSWLAC